MLPGKKYSFDEVLRVLRRRYWLLLVPCAVASALAAYRAQSMPNLYSAETVIMVTPQSVPETIVAPVVTSRIQDRVATLRTSILSRTRLERVILEYGLYEDERRAGWPMEELVRKMGNNISTNNEGSSSFRVGFTGTDPVKVRDVTDRLARMFIEESLADRQDQADNTNEFIDSQLVEYEAKLKDREMRLAAWKARYSGELPSQVQGNLQQIETASGSLRDLRASMTADNQARLEYHKMLAQMQDPNAIAEATAGSNPAVEQAVAAATGPTQQLLNAARAQLDGETQRGRKPGHPDYDAAARKVRDYENRLNREMAGASASSAAANLSPAELARRARIQQIRNEITRLDAQIAKAQAEEHRLVAVSAEAQRRVDMAPQRENELTELSRDYESIRATYNRMLANRQSTQVAANLERKQGGEQFRLLDAAQLPERPVSPNRRQDIGFGLLLGLVVGLGLVGFLEYQDKSLRTDEDVALVLDLPVLAVVPVMRSEEDLRARTFKQTFTAAGLGSVVAVCAAFAAWVAVR